ncbi:hypothetical protein BGZ50_004381 [Haplosporangium sp. Z 11]|nr:hypothetical protein BGZ50_004381 [Haplosporangium sp. Z 11]
MISTIRSWAFLTVLVFVSTCLADVYIKNPFADTNWKIGKRAEIRWHLTTPTAKTDVATIYLVGGDPKAYKRLVTLEENVILGSHKLTIPSVPDVNCGNTCAIQFMVDGGGFDYYSHSFTISGTGAPSSIPSPSPAAVATTDKSGPGKYSSFPVDVLTDGLIFASQGSTSGGAPLNGPITLVQNAASKGNQEQSMSTSMHTLNQGAFTTALILAMCAISMPFLF